MNNLPHLSQGRGMQHQVYTSSETVPTLFVKQANSHPGQTAIIDGELKIDYKQLQERVNNIAGELIARGVTPASLVGVCMGRTWETVATLLGVLQAGCAYVPLDPAYPRERVRYMLEHSRAVAAIVDNESTAELCHGVDELIHIDKVVDKSTEDLTGPSASDLAYVIYTSGSTGKPKGVAIEHGSVVAMIQAMDNLLHKEDLKGMLASTSICFDPSLMEIIGTLALGGTVVLAKNILDLPALDAANLLTSCVAVPSAMQALLSTGWTPNGLKSIVFGIEALKPALIEELFRLNPDLRIYNAYGPTEDTVFSTATEIFQDTKTITIGKSVQDSRAYVLDATMNPVADGKEGELYLAGNKLARGYLYDEERTNERFVKPGAESGIAEDRMYKTGDLCRRLENGEIEFLGRVDHQVKIRGFRVELEEVETALEAMECIDAAAAVAIDGGSGQKMLKAYVVSRTKALDDTEVKAWVAGKLPKYMVPHVVTQLDELPKLPNGKLDRKKLQEMKETSPAEMMSQTAGVEASQDTDFLTVIQAEVASLLNYSDPAQVDPDRSFDDLGLDSLTTIELSSRLSRKLDRQLPASVIMNHPTPAELVEFLQKGTDQESKKKRKAYTDSLATFQTMVRSSHPTFQAAKVAAWSATDKGKLVQEVLQMVNTQNKNPYSKVLSTGSGTRGMVTDAYHQDETREAVIWTTNLYLGMNRDPEVMEAAAKAVKELGTGMGTSAAASGMTDNHLQFEKEFAELTGKPAACLYPTGYTANVGAVAGILDKNDVVIIDQLCHASIVDGAILCGATIRTFKHNDAADLESVLQSEASPYRTVMVILEGVYSMGEGAAPVAEITRTAKKYGALVLVDEAHSFGFYGDRGAGICAAQGITEEVDFIMTTLSKGMGSLGGVVAASQEHVDLMKAASRAYIFQASVSPADIVAALTALRRIKSDDSIRERLWSNTHYMRRKFKEAGFDLGATGDGPIVTPHFADKDKLYAIVHEMYKLGVQTSAVTYPIVEPGRGRLRLICSSSHTREDVDKTVEALIEAERIVDEQLAMARAENDKVGITINNVQDWADTFTTYLKKVVANATMPTPDLAISVRIENQEETLTIVVNKGEVTQGASEASGLPTCTLLLKNDHVITALRNSDLQALLYGVSNGTCILNGQVEAFVWFIARIADQKKENNNTSVSAQSLEEAVY